MNFDTDNLMARRREADGTESVPDPMTMRRIFGAPALVIDPEGWLLDYAPFKERLSAQLKIFRREEMLQLSRPQRLLRSLSACFNTAAHARSDFARLSRLVLGNASLLHESVQNMHKNAPANSFALLGADPEKIGYMASGYARASVIFAPRNAGRPEHMLTGLKPEKTLQPPYGATWRYQCLMHEFAHVAGAQEAQADKFAAFMTRRHYPQSPLPSIVADLRAVNVMKVALLAVRQNNKAACALFLQNMHDYGWDMVEAADEVCALPQSRIDVMSGADVMQACRTKQKNDVATIYMMGHLAQECEQLHSYDLAVYAAGAAKFADSVEGAPYLRAMAQRHAEAAQRLARGLDSYKDRARQFFMLPRPV